MRKWLALLLVILALPAVSCPAYAQTASTQPPEVTDLTSLLSMTRADVTALIGKGEALPFADISDYSESGFQIGGFPYVYNSCGGTTVFYDAAPQAEGTVPYGCVESDGDRVLGVMLKPDSLALNVAGFQAGLSAQAISSLEKEFKVKVEHVNGLYEYYSIRAEIGGIQYVWVSDFNDMAGSVMYASLIPDTGKK